MTWPLDAFWNALARVRTLRRETTGQGMSPQDRAAHNAKALRDRAKWGKTGAWW